MNSALLIICMNSAKPSATSAGGSFFSPVACLRLAREVVGLDHAVGAGPHADPTDQVGPQLGSQRLELLVTLLHLGAIDAGDLHELHEAGVVRPTGKEVRDVAGLAELDWTVEQLLGLRPPRALLGAVAVRPRRILGLEPCEGDDATVGGDASGRSDIALGAGLELSDPLVELRPKTLGVRGLAFDHLHEHDVPPGRRLIAVF